MAYDYDDEEEGGNPGSEAELECCEEIISAVKSGNAEELCEALKAFLAEAGEASEDGDGDSASKLLGVLMRQGK